MDEEIRDSLVRLHEKLDAVINRNNDAHDAIKTSIAALSTEMGKLAPNEQVQRLTLRVSDHQTKLNLVIGSLGLIAGNAVRKIFDWF